MGSGNAIYRPSSRSNSPPSSKFMGFIAVTVCIQHCVGKMQSNCIIKRRKILRK
jgi:hypothetical protein